MSLEVRSDGVAQAPRDIEVIKIPEGVNPTAFRSVLAAYTTAYRTLGVAPSVEQVWAYWTKIPTKSVGEIMVTPEFRQALAARGIVLGDTPGLTHVQHLALMMLSDPNDRRTPKQKLEAVGATTQQYASWQRQPTFQAARRAMASRVWEDGVDDLKVGMMQQAAGGSFQHQQFIMETLGEGPKAREQANAQQLVMSMVGAVQKATVGHPEIRAAIMAELQHDLAALRLAQIEAAR